MMKFLTQGAMRRRLALSAAAAATVALWGVSASAHGFVGVSIGLPVFYPAPVYAPPPVYYAPAPVYYAPPPPPPPPPAVIYPSSAASYVAQDGRTCRQYQTTIMVNGVAERGYGTACLDADGVWRVAP